MLTFYPNLKDFKIKKHPYHHTIDKKGPYIGMWKKVKPKEFVVTLGIPTKDLFPHYKEDKDIQGIKRSYLEGVAPRMDGAERWGSFVDVLDLIIIGIILFPMCLTLLMSLLLTSFGL